MDVREKLVESVDRARRYAAKKCHSFMSCADCDHYGEHDGNCRNTYIAESLIADGVTVQEWISVKDRLPDMNEEVFAVYKNSMFENGPKFTKVLHRESKHWVDSNGYRYLYENITHWMTLPQPPKGE